jgi:3-oxoacyl-[acyl-carrier protein] reductase
MGMFSLAGRGALVTGASGGIGSAIARTLHAAGATVAISGTKIDRLETLAGELKERVHVVPCDLDDRAAVQKLAGEAEAKLGTLDILVNNAGMTRDNLFMRMKDEEWDQVIAVDLTSAFMLCRAAVRNMMRRQWGRIINITSISGIIGNPGQGNYAAAKAGMIGMTKSLAREVAARGITANCIAPGFIKTAMTDALTEKQVEAIAQHIPAQTFGVPEDIAAAALYLASEEARYMTGQTLHVNGGMAMV